MPALLVSIDGPDFSGKTTIANLLLQILREKNMRKEIIFKRTEVPSTLLTGFFTKILRNSLNKVSSHAFALAHALDHLYHFENYIEPLRKSKEKYIVIQERSLLSTFVYQGILGDIDFKWLEEINKFDRNYPQLTLILKLNLQELLRRKIFEIREFDKFEVENHLKKQSKVYYDLPNWLKECFNAELVDANDKPTNVAKKCAERIEQEILVSF